jgi:hypothetical protein
MVKSKKKSYKKNLIRKKKYSRKKINGLQTGGVINVYIEENVIEQILILKKIMLFPKINYVEHITNVPVKYTKEPNNIDFKNWSIRKCYLKLSQIIHPDKHSTGSTKMKTLIDNYFSLLADFNNLNIIVDYDYLQGKPIKLSDYGDSNTLLWNDIIEDIETRSNFQNFMAHQKYKDIEKKINEEQTNAFKELDTIVAANKLQHNINVAQAIASAKNDMKDIYILKYIKQFNRVIYTPNKDDPDSIIFVANGIDFNKTIDNCISELNKILDPTIHSTISNKFTLILNEYLDVLNKFKIKYGGNTNFNTQLNTYDTDTRLILTDAAEITKIKDEVKKEFVDACDDLRILIKDINDAKIKKKYKNICEAINNK